MMTCVYKSYRVLLSFYHHIKSSWSTLLKCWGWHKKNAGEKKKAQLRSSAMPGLTQCVRPESSLCHFMHLFLTLAPQPGGALSLL